MKILLLLLLIISFSHVQAQKRALIADETWLASSGSSSFRIITSNDTISKMISGKFISIVTKYTYVMKKDRKGKYWERSYYFNNSDYNTVIIYIKNDFK